MAIAQMCLKGGWHAEKDGFLLFCNDGSVSFVTDSDSVFHTLCYKLLTHWNNFFNFSDRGAPGEALRRTFSLLASTMPRYYIVQYYLCQYLFTNFHSFMDGVHIFFCTMSKLLTGRKLYSPMSISASFFPAQKPIPFWVLWLLGRQIYNGLWNPLGYQHFVQEETRFFCFAMHLLQVEGVYFILYSVQLVRYVATELYEMTRKELDWEPLYFISGPILILLGMYVYLCPKSIIVT